MNQHANSSYLEFLDAYALGVDRGDQLRVIGLSAVWSFFQALQEDPEFHPAEGQPGRYALDFANREAASRSRLLVAPSLCAAEPR